MAEVSLSKKLVAEFIGTGALVFAGPGTAAATFMLINGQKEGDPTAYTFDMAHLGIISFAFMMVIIAIIYAIGHISGCHINPAITIALAATKKAPWSDVPGYIVAQFAGAIAGALAIWGVLGEAGVKAGLGVLSYTPGNDARAFFAELIGTFLLAFVVFGTATDSRATPGWYGLAIPSIVFAVITIVGPVTGAALNPARYTGPMVARLIAGGGEGLIWTQHAVYFGATILGAVIAGFVYAYIGSVKADKAAESVSA